MVESVASNLGMLVNATDLLSFIFDVIQADGKDYGPFDPGPLPVAPSPPQPAPVPIPTVMPASPAPSQAASVANSGLTWGNFQSFIQLSVALNAAYFSVAQFLNPDARKERDRLSELNRIIVEYGANAARGRENNTADFQGRAFSIIQSISQQEEKDRQFFGGFRMISVVAFYVGIVLLFLSSIWPAEAIPTEVIVSLWLLFAPFIAGVAYAVFSSSRAYKKVSEARFSLSKEVDKFYLLPPPTPPKQENVLSK